MATDLSDGASEWEQVLAEAREKARAKAADYRAEAKRLNQLADDLDWRVSGSEAGAHVSTDRVSGSSIVRDWRRVPRSRALGEYMRNFPIGQKIQIADVAKALKQGGCDVSGKLRPGRVDFAERGREELVYCRASERQTIWIRPQDERDLAHQLGRTE